MESLGIQLGYRYDDFSIVVPDGTPPGPDDPSEYIQTARPGARAPHAWLADGRSTLDLFGRSFVLLRFSAERDVSALTAAADEVGMPLEVVDIRDEFDPRPLWRRSSARAAGRPYRVAR